MKVANPTSRGVPRHPSHDQDRLADAAAKQAQGYWPAPTPGVCGVCRRRIYERQWIRKLPDGYRPDSKRRHAHHACIEQLIEKVRSKAAALDGGAPSDG